MKYFCSLLINKTNKFPNPLLSKFVKNSGISVQNYKCFCSKVDGQTKVKATSWAAKDLREQGEPIEPISKDAPYILCDGDDIDKPSDKIKNIVQEILALNMFEAQQFLNLLQKRLGLTDEKIYRQFGINFNNRDFSSIDKKYSDEFGGSSSTSDGSGIARPVAAAAPTPAKEEKTAFDIKLTVVDAKVKIKVIKEVRTITGLGLKEAKELVEKAPVVVKQGLKKEEADSFKKLLVDAGAEVEIL